MSPDEVKAGLEQALARSRDGSTIQDVESDLAAGRATLWIGERSAMVTQLVNTPEGRLAHVWLGCGAIGELLRIAPGAEAWARANGCKWTTIDGRPGWTGALQKRGYVRNGHELRKVL